MIKAILFDIDGTLLDTSEFILQAFEYALIQEGVTNVSRSDIAQKMGPPLFEMYSILAPNIEVAKLVRAHRDFQADKLHLSIPFPGVKDILSKIGNHGIRIGAVTSRSNENSIKTLELADIKQYFEIIVSFEDVKKHKPDPEGIFMALEHMNIKPNNAMMVGDTHVDIEAGKNAGLTTVGITHGIRGDEVKTSNPDYLITSLLQLLEILDID